MVMKDITKLTELTDQELNAELERRKQVKKEEEARQRIEKIKLVLEHKDVLMKLMTHARTSCKTSNNAYYHPYHGAAGCNLCCLEALHESDDDIEIAIDIRLYKIND